ncbi:MAG: prepilin peptidase [Lachnospiraceae bacterium]|nr:prepilin peptidase [Lachnospiraceae bacterium]
MHRLVINTTLLTALSVCTYTDLKYRKIPGFLLALLTAGGILYVILLKDYGNPMRYMGVSVGLVFCLLSLLSRQAVGMGDTVLFAILGWYLGLGQVLLLLFGAFCMAAVFSALLLVSRKGTFKTRLPFVPFLYVAFAGMCVVSGL